MPWAPNNDFEEEVVNLQPHYNFTYGVLSEPEYNYPRPKAHTEYAAKKKSEGEDTGTGNMNGKLHVIQQVQRMAKTKAVGEQPALEDWDNNKTIEQETIGMIRYCGMGVSVDRPLNEKVTIATYPVENTIKMVQNGRKKVALYFDDNVFKLKEKVSDTSSGFNSCNNSGSHECQRNETDNSLSSELDCCNNPEANCNSSFVSNSSLFNSFSTAADNSDSLTSASTFKILTSSSTRLKPELSDYEKLLEETSKLSLNTTSSSNNSHAQNIDCTKTSDEQMSYWTPVSDYDENELEKQESWPDLPKKIISTKKSKSNNNAKINQSNKKVNVSKNNCQSDSTDDYMSSDMSSTNVFKTKSCEQSDTSSNSATASQGPTTYATITKAPKSLEKSDKRKKETPNSSSNMIIDFQPFYTTRRMYALKRREK